MVQENIVRLPLRTAWSLGRGVTKRWCRAVPAAGYWHWLTETHDCHSGNPGEPSAWCQESRHSPAQDTCVSEKSLRNSSAGVIIFNIPLNMDWWSNFKKVNDWLHTAVFLWECSWLLGNENSWSALKRILDQLWKVRQYIMSSLFVCICPWWSNSLGVGACVRPCGCACIDRCGTCAMLRLRWKFCMNIKGKASIYVRVSNSM